MARVIERHDFLRKAVAFGLVPPLAAIAYVTLYTSPAEKAILFLLVAGGVAAGWRLIRRCGGFAFVGRMRGWKMWESLITTEVNPL